MTLALDAASTKMEIVNVRHSSGAMDRASCLVGMTDTIALCPHLHPFFGLFDTLDWAVEADLDSPSECSRSRSVRALFIGYGQPQVSKRIALLAPLAASRVSLILFLRIDAACGIHFVASASCPTDRGGKFLLKIFCSLVCACRACSGRTPFNAMRSLRRMASIMPSCSARLIFNSVSSRSFSLVSIL